MLNIQHKLLYEQIICNNGKFKYGSILNVKLFCIYGGDFKLWYSILWLGVG